jgi:hypothetical protein
LFATIQALQHEREKAPFEFPHSIRQRMRGAQTGKYMDVISDSAHGMRSSAQAANDSAKLFMDTVARRCSKPLLPAFLCSKQDGNAVKDASIPNGDFLALLLERNIS